ncbi:hypothetical protein GCM10023083_91000 [Streptomyces phyllanthi]
METIRLTTAQALVRFLAGQYSERDGQEQRLIPGVWGIFGHGNVAGLGQALLQAATTGEADCRTTTYGSSSTVPKQCPGVTFAANSRNCAHPERCWMRWSPAFAVSPSGCVHRVHAP